MKFAADTCLAMAGEYGQPKYEGRGPLVLGGALAGLGEAKRGLAERKAARLAGARVRWPKASMAAPIASETRSPLQGALV
ncbi:MAG: hypothetical protein ACRDH5_03070, partial [bacterium]